MNINRTTNRVSFRTTRSKSSCAQMTNSVKQDSFGEVLKQTSAKDTFNSTSSVKRTPTNEVASSVPDTQAKLDKISEAIKNTDYSEMSKHEIHADIEKKYADSFEEFYATFAVWTCEDYNMIHHHYLDELNKFDFSATWNNNDTLIARGYSGYDEAESAIKEKYAGKTSFMDQLNLFGELFSAGVLSNKYGWDNATNMTSHLNIVLDCGGNGLISKNEWLSRIEEMGVSSPFSLLLNNPYFAKDKELFQSMVDDILFGIADEA